MLGGDISAPIPDHAAMARASLAYAPIGFATIFVIVCLFVAALMVTAGMVDEIDRVQRPEARESLARIAPQWRGILLFSLKFLVAYGVFGAGVSFLYIYLLDAVHHQELATSAILLPMMVLVEVGCVAWLVTPAAIRLLQHKTTGLVSAQARNRGTILAILAAEVGMALGVIAQKMEARIILDSQWEFTALSALNSIVANAPDVLLFIALALIAAKYTQETAIEVSVEAGALPPEQLPE